MRGIEKVVEEVLPSRSEESSMEKIMEEVLCRVKDVSGKYQDVVGVELGGSVAKGTWLVGKSDIDIFVKFDKNTSTKDFVKKSLEIGFGALKEYDPYAKYSQHPYVVAKTRGVVLNVVPCYNVNLGEWQSAADRSPYHTTHIRSVLSYDMKNEVRVLKKFLIVRGLYGSHTEIQGFSGYVSEVLVSKFGSFENVMEEMGCVRKYEVLGNGVASPNTLVTIIDPIDSNRNLAAAISARSMGRFILECRRFRNAPSTTTFYPNTSRVDNYYDRVVCAVFSYQDKDLDILWAQSKSAAAAIGHTLDRSGFTVVRKGVAIDDRNVQLSFLLTSLTIPSMVVKRGPSVLRQSSTHQFIQTNRDTMRWVDEEGVMCCLIFRAHTSADSVLEYVLSNPTKTGIPQGIHDDISKGCVVRTGSQMSSGEIQNAKFLMMSDV